MTSGEKKALGISALILLLLLLAKKTFAGQKLTALVTSKLCIRAGDCNSPAAKTFPINQSDIYNPAEATFKKFGPSLADAGLTEQTIGTAICDTNGNNCSCPTGYHVSPDNTCVGTVPVSSVISGTQQSVDKSVEVDPLAEYFDLSQSISYA